IYDALFVNPAVTGSREVLWKGLDVGIIDGSVNGVGRTIQGSADLLKHLQNGLVRSYASWILAGTIAALFYIYSLIRR
ncbi:MAG: NADH-quinone oxidoreductase subunit L, partial [Acidobacteria bacterium]